MVALQAHRVETTLNADGEVILNDLPFEPGEAVEVIVLKRDVGLQSRLSHPYEGVPLHYDRPTEPVAVEDWDALR